MARGGKRAGAGRKSTWASGCTQADTKLIRVPIAIADQVLEMAHRLDSGDALDLVTRSKTESDIQTVIDFFRKWQDLSDRANTKSVKWAEARRLLAEARELVKSLVEPGSVQMGLPDIELPFDSETDSKGTSQEAHKDIFEALGPLKTPALAARLRLSRGTIGSAKKKYWPDSPFELSKWLQERDPDGIAWEYREPEKLYYPIDPQHQNPQASKASDEAGGSQRFNGL